MISCSTVAAPQQEKETFLAENKVNIPSVFWLRSEGQDDSYRKAVRDVVAEKEDKKARQQKILELRASRHRRLYCVFTEKMAS